MKLQELTLHEISNITLPHKNFKFNENTYSVFGGKKDSNILIKNISLDTKTTTLKAFLASNGFNINDFIDVSNISNKNNNKHIYQKFQENEKTTKFNYTNLHSVTFTPIEFFKYLQITEFEEDYKQSENIKMYKNKICIYANRDERVNLRYRSSEGWYTFKKADGVESIGAYKKSSNKTLILVEGLKDFLNATIAFKGCSILATDTKSMPYTLDDIELNDYSNIILLQDREVTDANILTLLRNFPSLHQRKIKYLDYSLAKNNEKDTTDFIVNFNLPRAELKKKSITLIKKFLHKKKIDTLINNKKISEEIDPKIANPKNENEFMRAVDEKRKKGGDITHHIALYLKNNATAPADTKIINLVNSKYISNIASSILDTFNTSNKVLLGSPTGTGKTTFIKNFPKHSYKNMIIITPLSSVAEEFVNDEIVLIKREGRLENSIADLHKKKIVMTTDTFYNLLHNKETKSYIKERIKEAELIIFDEQHLVKQSLNFREKVVFVMEFLKKYNGKVLAMSGTPIFSDLPNFKAVNCILNNKFVSDIQYHLDPFKDDLEVLNQIKKSVKNGSVLLYVKSKKIAKTINNYLIENSVNTCKIISDENLYRDRKIDNSEIKNIKENIVYISTTKATTGTNFNNLKTIFQIGTAYDTNTFIQLVARLRGAGDYYYIKLLNDTARDKQNTNKAINILNIMRELKITNLNSLFKEEHRNILKKRVDLPTKKQDLQTLLSTYKEPLETLIAHGLGKFKDRKKEDFEINENILNLNKEKIKDILKDVNEIEYSKYIERTYIDYLQKNNNISMLNNIYNLSFNLIVKQSQKFEDIKAKTLLSNEDLKLKKDKKEDKKEDKQEFENEVIKVFDWILTDRNQKLFYETFTRSEIERLMIDDRLQKESVRALILKGKDLKVEDKFLKLKFFIINKFEIIKLAKDKILEKNYVTLTEIAEGIEQEIFLTMRTGKKPFLGFVKDLFLNDDVLKDKLIYRELLKIDSKLKRDVITLNIEDLAEIKKEKNYEEKNNILRKKLAGITDKLLEDLTDLEKEEFTTIIKENDKNDKNLEKEFNIIVERETIPFKHSDNLTSSRKDDTIMNIKKE